MGWRRLRRVVVVTIKAIIACRCQRAAPTITTIFEIVALTAPLVRTPHDALADASAAATASGGGSGSETAAEPPPLSAQSPQLQARGALRRGGAGSGDGRARQQQQQLQQRSHRHHHAAQGVLASPVDAARVLLLLGVRLARGWAPAVVVAQGVRLVASLVHKRQHPDEDARQEGTEVRALQLGLTAVPRVDPRVPRTLEQYCSIYREWLLLLRGRLAQSGLELPEGLFDPEQDGDEELMRFALCYNLLQARSLKDALVAMDRTISNIREFSVWYARYQFIAPADLEAWQRIAWWEGPDGDGLLWLMIDFRAAVEASRTHGPELVARVLVSNMEYGVRQLIPELGCGATLRVVVDASGVHVNAALRMRGVFQRVGHVIDRMYPCRLHVLYIVGLPFPLRWGVRAAMQLLHAHTRRKMRLCRATDVPRRLPSQLRSHKLSLAAGLDGWAVLDSQQAAGGYGAGGADAAAATAGAAFDSFDSGGGGAGGGGIMPFELGPAGYNDDGGGGGGSIAAAPAGPHSVVGSDFGGEPFTPRTPLQRGGGGGLRGFRWRRGAAGRGSRLAGGAQQQPGDAAARRRRLRARLLRGGFVVLLGAALLLLLGYLVLLQRLVPELGALAGRRLRALLRRAGAGIAPRLRAGLAQVEEAMALEEGEEDG